MPSLLYWGLGTSVYLHSSSSTPTDLQSQSHYYISVACMPVKMLYSCRFMYADLALKDLCCPDLFLFWCPWPKTCQEVIPTHAHLYRKRRIIPMSHSSTTFNEPSSFLPWYFVHCVLFVKTFFIAVKKNHKGFVNSSIYNLIKVLFFSNVVPLSHNITRSHTKTNRGLVGCWNESVYIFLSLCVHTFPSHASSEF